MLYSTQSKGRLLLVKKQLEPSRTRLEYLPGQVLFRVREQAVRPQLPTAPLRFTAADAKRLPAAAFEPLDYLRRNAGLKTVRPVFSTRRKALGHTALPLQARQSMAVLTSVADSESEELTGINVLFIDPKKVTSSLLNHLGASKAVEFVEPMPARWLAAVPADPMLNFQWGLRAIRWFQANKPDASTVRVAVLDTGIDPRHPEFKDVSVDYHHEGLSADDLIGHGTHVVGIIAATTNNDVGVSGVASCCVSVWKVFPDEPYQDDFYVDFERYLRALNAAIGAGAKVVNLSLGGTASSRTEALLFRRLERSKIVVVAAMGNEYQEGNPTEYPAAYEGVLAVGAVAENLRRARFSNTGKHIGLTAPGANILSTLPTKTSPYRDEVEYAAWSGTSMATPHVAAAAALVVARHPNKKATEVKQHLRDTATRLPEMRGRKRTSAYGTGLLNLQKALS